MLWTALKQLVFMILLYLFLFGCSSTTIHDENPDGDVDLDLEKESAINGDQDALDNEKDSLIDGEPEELEPEEDQTIVDGDISESDIEEAKDNEVEQEIEIEIEELESEAEEDDAVYQSNIDPYLDGGLTVYNMEISEGENNAPKDMTIYTPLNTGKYAVVMFHHGFIMNHKVYSGMLTHLASHGFIVVAPQMYPPLIPIGVMSSAEEAIQASQVYDWIKVEIENIVGVEVDLNKIGLMGHSRGAKVSWTHLKNNGSADFMAVAGLDPVDGTGGPGGTETRVVDGQFSFSIPALIIGTGLGPSGISPCAPSGDNHIQFYAASNSPAWHVVATNNGHNDMTDDNCGVACLACSSGGNKDKVRQLFGGLLSAFFRFTLQDDIAAVDVLSDIERAPVSITVESKL